MVYRLMYTQRKQKSSSENDDVIVDFDPLYLGIRTILDHSFHGNFDQH